MENISALLYVGFALTTLMTLLLFFKATRWSKPLMISLIVWMLIQSVVALNGFYLVTDTIPPRFLLAVMPVVVLILSFLFFNKGRYFLERLDLSTLTLLNVVRVPVELCLYALFQAKSIPELMTFSGSNPDILSGITAPVMYYLVFKKKWLGRNALIAWNIICILLLVNIVTRAILAAPFPFQQIAFDQPNVGVLYFPFILLPAVIVPIVLLSHVASLKQLFKLRTVPGTSLSIENAG